MRQLLQIRLPAGGNEPRLSCAARPSASASPRLDSPGSRQNGGIRFGAGCFEGIRNISAHVDGLELTDQEALEPLAAISVLARWIDECEVEAVSEPSS